MVVLFDVRVDRVNLWIVLEN